MTISKKLRLIRDISRLESELAAKKAQLEALEGTVSEREQLLKRTPEESQKALADLVRRIGEASCGGNSVEDQRKERERCK